MVQPTVLSPVSILTVNGIPIGAVLFFGTDRANTLHQLISHIGLGSAKIGSGRLSVIQGAQLLLLDKTEVTVVGFLILLQNPQSRVTVTVIDIYNRFIRSAEIIGVFGISIGIQRQRTGDV